MRLAQSSEAAGGGVVLDVIGVFLVAAGFLRLIGRHLDVKHLQFVALRGKKLIASAFGAGVAVAVQRHFLFAVHAPGAPGGALDDKLQAINSDYEAKRYKDITLQHLEVVKARPNLFNDWLKAKGKLGGQHKVPRLNNSRDIMEQLLRMNNTKNED